MGGWRWDFCRYRSYWRPAHVGTLSHSPLRRKPADPGAAHPGAVCRLPRGAVAAARWRDRGALPRGGVPAARAYGADAVPCARHGAPAGDAALSRARSARTVRLRPPRPLLRADAARPCHGVGAGGTGGAARGRARRGEAGGRPARLDAAAGMVRERPRAAARRRAGNAARGARPAGPAARRRCRAAAAAAAAFTPRAEPGRPQAVLAEAGTGVGKTLGYLVPASLWAEKNGGSVWISTYTRNLQSQIAGELDRLYPDPERKRRDVAIRKGRENFLCLLNYEDAVAAAAMRPGRAAIDLGLIARWI